MTCLDAGAGVRDGGRAGPHLGPALGCNNDVGHLRMVLMHRPGDELKIVDPAKRLPDIGAFGDVEQGWYWRGDTIPPLTDMQQQHDALVAALREEGTEVVFLDGCAPGRMKSCYTRDSMIAVDGGAIVTRLGPPIRRGEEARSPARWRRRHADPAHHPRHRHPGRRQLRLDQPEDGGARRLQPLQRRGARQLAEVLRGRWASNCCWCR
jgi:hypothetical protein